MEFQKGGLDTKREGESRVWRRLELSRSEMEMALSASGTAEENIQTGGGPGYWVKKDVVDWFKPEKMCFYNKTKCTSLHDGYRVSLVELNPG